jgi:hypothetical protein
MQAKVITNFVRLNESDFQTKVALIVASLTGNARFPEPWGRHRRRVWRRSMRLLRCIAVRIAPA